MEALVAEVKKTLEATKIVSHYKGEREGCYNVSPQSKPRSMRGTRASSPPRARASRSVSRRPGHSTTTSPSRS